MSYLKDFKKQIELNNFSKFMQLWEEYVTSDTADVEEFLDILKSVKNSELTKPFGQYIEMAMPLWKTIQDEKDSYAILKALIDLENTNTPALAEVTIEALRKRYAEDPQFNDRLRLIGMRTRENFQGALSNYDLLAHLKKGNIVFHGGGWGTGEIISVSPVMEQVVIEFENIRGRKDLSFANAFKAIIPLSNDHFLARRFSNPDDLEKEARENPIQVIRLLLRDLGPKDAGEIKDELCELVIPEQDWTKWWQNVRTKIKKDTMIQSPEGSKEPFVLRKAEVSHAERFQSALEDKTGADEIIKTTYNYVRDHPDMLKNKEVKSSLKEKLEALLGQPDLTPEQKVQLLILLENNFGYKNEANSLQKCIQESTALDELVKNIEIVAFKKRVISGIREFRQDWIQHFLTLLFSLQQSPLRDYALKELISQKESLELVNKKIEHLIEHPGTDPETFVWYFQKAVAGEEIPFGDKEGQCRFFEAFLILYSTIENRTEYKDLLKKMYQLLSGKRYAIVRMVIEGTSVDYLKEILLLASKCQSLSDHDIKILISLAEVVQPSLNSAKKGNARVDSNSIWTTEEGYHKTKEQIKHIGTVEIVENAREIEAARALGDLRENSEYKFALEKRSRLQGHLKMLSDQFNRARIITKDDIPSEEVGIGSVVDLVDGTGKRTTYTILGPWDADVDKNILSFQSKLAQTLIGNKEGDKFKFRDEDYTVVAIKSFLK
jgi:transcription elongation factor GreA